MSTTTPLPVWRFAILVFGVVGLYAIGLGNIPLFDWDEVNFAEISREMLVSNNWRQPTVNYFPFYEKPPLFFWMQLISFRAFGVDAFSARLPNVLCGLMTLWSLWYMGRQLNGNAFGIWWAAFFGASILPHLYFRSGIIDPWFNLFTFWSIFLLYDRGSKRIGWGKTLGAGILLGLAVLTKGPAAGLIVGILLALHLWQHRSTQVGNWWKYTLAGLLGLLPIYLWLVNSGGEGDEFAGEFLRYQWRLFSKEDAGHGGFPGFHLIVLLFGCFPAAPFALPRLLRKEPPENRTAFDRWMKSLVWIVLIVFTIVNTKIIHYSSLAYFPLCYLAALSMENKFADRISQFSLRLLSGTWVLYGSVFFLLPLLGYFLLPLPTPVAYDWQWPLTSQVSWSPLLSLLALPFFLIPRRLGRRFKNDARIIPFVRGHLFLAFYFVGMGLWVFAGRIQTYTQGPLEAFYVEHSAREVYLGTAYHKSYIPWFYGKVPPETGAKERQWRFHGPTDLDLLFSSPRHRTEQVLREVPDAVLLYQEGGFSFYRRPAATNQGAGAKTDGTPPR